MDERIIRQVLYCSSDVLIEGRGSAYLADIVGLLILRFLRVAQSQAILCGRARPNVLDFAVALASFGMSYVDLIAYLENSSSNNKSSSSNPFEQSCQNQLVIAAPNEESMQQQQRKHFYHFFPPLPPEYTFKRTTIMYSPTEEILEMANRKAIQQRQAEEALFRLLQSHHKIGQYIDYEK